MHATINININRNSPLCRRSPRTPPIPIPLFAVARKDFSSNICSKTICNSTTSQCVWETLPHPLLSYKSHFDILFQREPSRIIVRSTVSRYSIYLPYYYSLCFGATKVKYKEECRRKSISLFSWPLTSRNRKSLPFPTLAKAYKVVQNIL